LNSYGGDKCAINEGTKGVLPGIVSVALGETIFGERMIAERMIAETMPTETVPTETMPVATMAAAMFVEAEPWGGPETILLVEDEGFVRKVTAEVLASAGYKLVIARNGPDALDAYRGLSVPVDLLLADVVMPGMSGRELANEFETLCPTARVLLMSGYARQLAWCQVSPYGNAYLAKPFSVRMLLRKVREVLDANPFDSGALA
jgi:CheY-like chemotaxis protein